MDYFTSIIPSVRSKHRLSRYSSCRRYLAEVSAQEPLSTLCQLPRTPWSVQSCRRTCLPLSAGQRSCCRCVDGSWFLVMVDTVTTLSTRLYKLRSSRTFLHFFFLPTGHVTTKCCPTQQPQGDSLLSLTANL